MYPRLPADEGVVAVAAIESVVARAAVEGVVSDSAVDDVVAAQCIDVFAQRGAFEYVVLSVPVMAGVAMAINAGRLKVRSVNWKVVMEQLLMGSSGSKLSICEFVAVGKAELEGAQPQRTPDSA